MCCARFIPRLRALGSSPAYARSHRCQAPPTHAHAACRVDPKIIFSLVSRAMSQSIVRTAATLRCAYTHTHRHPAGFSGRRPSSFHKQGGRCGSGRACVVAAMSASTPVPVWLDCDPGALPPRAPPEALMSITSHVLGLQPTRLLSCSQLAIQVSLLRQRAETPAVEGGVNCCVTQGTTTRWLSFLRDTIRL